MAGARERPLPVVCGKWHSKYTEEYSSELSRTQYSVTDTDSDSVSYNYN